jgi:hypothetical protein
MDRPPIRVLCCPHCSAALNLSAQNSFRQAGLRILDWTAYTMTITYHDIAAVVYELMHVPWSVIDFDLDRYRPRLFRLHRRMQAEGGLRRRGDTYVIEAEKP